ncbi:MAG: hypothetical protein ACRCW0_04860 [Clostridium sp.]
MNSFNNLSMRLKMFISSYFPLYAILLILYYDKFNSIEKIKQILKFKDTTISIFIIALIVFIVISMVTCIDLKRTSGNEKHNFRNIENTGDTLISYMMTYIVPILSIDLADDKTLIINLILYVLIGFMYIKLNLIYLNPLFLFFGYYIYKSENEVVIISNITYGELKGLGDIKLKSSVLGNGIYLVQRKDNIDIL